MVFVSETTYSPEELLAMVLEKAKSSAEAFAGKYLLSIMNCHSVSQWSFG